MSTNTTLLVTLGLAYLISVVAYFNRAIHELTHAEGKEQTDRPLNPSRGKVYYIASESRY